MGYIVVIGGATIDILAKPHNEIIMRDSNPSHIFYSQGGVARNIAENLARLGQQVKFVTALGNDGFAQQIKQRCLSLSIDLSHTLTCDQNTAVYLCVNDSQGDMLLAASDLDILANLDHNYLSSLLPLLNGADAVVIDTNLTVQTLKFLIGYVTTKVFLETVSANKTKKLVGLPLPYAIKPNVIEASILCGFEVGQHNVYQAMEKIAEKGAKYVVVTFRNQGCYYLFPEGQGHIEAPKVKIANTTGAGDSFFAAFIMTHLLGLSTKDCLQAANTAAALTIQSDNVCFCGLTRQLLFEKRKEYYAHSN